MSGQGTAHTRQHVQPGSPAHQLNSAGAAEAAVWWIGSTESAELAPAYRDLRAWDAQHSRILATFDTVAEAQVALANTPAPELMLLAVRRPGEYTHCAVAALQQRALLARHVALLGSLCEGEQRTGRPWPGVLRYYWHQWSWRLKPMLRRWLHVRREGSATIEATGHAPFPWELPLTATEDERCMSAVARAAEYCSVATAQARSGLVVVGGTDAAMVHTLVGLCRQAGWHASTWNASNGQSSALLASAGSALAGSASPKQLQGPNPPGDESAALTASWFPAASALQDSADTSCGNRTWHPGVAAGVWDSYATGDVDLSQFAAFVRRLAPAPVIAVVNFPRWNEVVALQEAGAVAVVSKPLYQGDLDAVLLACTSGSAEQGL